PEAPTAAAVRPYLREFLSDRRVVELPRLLWWPILNGIILRVRPQRSAKKYAAIWTEQGSPLKVHVERQTKLLRGFLGQTGHQVLVDHAMRYGNPSIADTLDRLKAQGCTRMLVVPLYPQYAASTTATVFDAVGRWLQSTRNTPEIRHVRAFGDHPGYIAALANSVREHWQRHGRPAKHYRLVISFHGLPRYSLDKGDPYYCECHKTARLLAEALQLSDDAYQLCFQSRFGRTEWLQPYTASTLSALARDGIQRVDVICPGFTADCLETLEEIAIEGKTTFIDAGGKEFHFLPCLNERDDWLHALTDLVSTHLQGWPTRTVPELQELQSSALRAKALGARQ
ncbi:MAG TPA: ferrochelatase, partial [Accumulibacter sp.]|nr:ferrochelatase [Accumulibacter sp.]